MKWASAASSHHILGTAIEDCVSSIRPEMAETPLDLAVLFVSSHFSEEYDSIPAIIQDKLGARVLFGCSGGGVIGGGREIENRPGCSLTVASLPGVDLVPFYLNGDDLPDLDSGPDSWEGAVGVTAESSPHFLLLLDPFSFPAQDFIQGMDFAFPRSVKVGGMASGGHRSGENALYLEDRAYRAGAIGLAMRGNLVVDTIVAQGCRPIGQLMCITKSQQNLLLELDGQPPLEVVQRLFSSSSERDREMMQNSLFLGMVMDDVIEEPQLGDFLIRNVIGLDSRTGTMAIGETLREGQRGPVPPQGCPDLCRRTGGPPGQARQSGEGKPVPGIPLVLLPRKRRAPVRPPGPRYRPFPGQSRANPPGGILLQRRDRPRGQHHLPPWVHQLLRDIPAP